MYRKKTSSWLKHWDFILLDLILLELSYLLAHWLYHGTAYYREAPLYRNVFFAIAAIDLVVGLMMGSYKGILRRGYWLETKAVAKHAIIVTVCVIAYLFAMKESSNYSRVVIFAFPIISICVLYIGRILLKKWLSKHRGPASGKRAILLIGGKKNYREIVEAFTSNPYSEFHVMGIGIIDAKENEIPNYHGFPVFCGESAIEDFAQLNWVDEALFSIPTELPLPDKMIKNFGIMGITIHIKLARVADDSSNQIVEKLEGYTVLSTSINMVSAGQLIFKRTMDICGGLVGMLLTGIIFIFVAPIIYIKSPGPIFFKQVRIGKNGKKFNIYKFRSMYMDAEERKKELMAQNDIKDGMMFKMDNDPRIIKGIGNFIRDYSLDEFPQFWNVLIGDMSLVGTRPPTVDEWEKYEMHHRSRLAFKPGLTGMWQVSGRSNITDFEEVVRLDTEYIKKWSPGLDIMILFKTVAVVLGKVGSKWDCCKRSIKSIRNAEKATSFKYVECRNVYSTKVHRYKGAEGTILVGEHYER